MNRVNVPNGEYQRVGQGDIRRIIEQPYQFDCAHTTLNGRPNAQNVYATPPEQIHYEIADWAMGGGLLNATGDSLWYFNPYGNCISEFPRNGSGTFHTRVNQHCFYRPTPQYALT